MKLELKLWLAEFLSQIHPSEKKRWYYYKRARYLTAYREHRNYQRNQITEGNYKLWIQVLTEGDYTCRRCRVRNYLNKDPYKPKMEVDHIVPIAKWGTSHRSNLQVLCRPCNQKKGKK